MILFPTTLVGSYPQPDWLIDRAKLAGQFPPRIRAKELWRVAPEYLEQAWQDATRLAIRAQEDAGLDIVTDGEIRRESYSNRFACALEGIDLDHHGSVNNRNGVAIPVPRIVGPIRRCHAVEADDVKFLRANTERAIKITVPGPFTMSEQAQDDFYGDGEAVAMAYAEALRGEIADLFSAGADIVQIDEPWMQSRPEKARQYGLQALNAALEGIEGETAVHICFGYAAVMNAKPAGYSFLSELRGCRCKQVSMETAQPKLDCEVLASLDNKRLMVGCIDLSDHSIETPEIVVGRIEKALRYVRPENVILAPDCGMKYLPREVADGKMLAMAAAAKILRQRYS